MFAITADDFNRSDSSSLGPVWVAIGGATWGITGNRAVMKTVSGSPLWNKVTRECRAADGDLIITLAETGSGGGENTGATFRYSDSLNYWTVDVRQTGSDTYDPAALGRLTVTKWMNGSEYYNIANAMLSTWLDDDQLRVSLLDDTMRFYRIRGGVETFILQYVDGFNKTATRHGLWSFYNGPGDPTSAHPNVNAWENFQFTPATVAFNFDTMLRVWWNGELLAHQADPSLYAITLEARFSGGEWAPGFFPLRPGAADFAYENRPALSTLHIERAERRDVEDIEIRRVGLVGSDQFSSELGAYPRGSTWTAAMADAGYQMKFGRTSTQELTKAGLVETPATLVVFPNQQGYITRSLDDGATFIPASDELHGVDVAFAGMYDATRGTSAIWNVNGQRFTVSTNGGQNWVQNPGIMTAPAPGAFIWQRFEQGAGTFLMTSTEKIGWSPDGFSWFYKTFPSGSSYVDGVWTGTQWLLVGRTEGYQPISWTSADGVTWTQGGAPTLPSGALLSFGTGSPVASPADPLKLAYLAEVEGIDSSFSLVSLGYAIVYSTDGGVTWPDSSIPAVAGSFVGLRYLANGTLIGMAQTTDYVASLWYSVDDGHTWSPSNFPSVPPGWAPGLATLTSTDDGHVYAWFALPAPADPFEAAPSLLVRTDDGVTWTVVVAEYPDAFIYDVYTTPGAATLYFRNPVHRVDVDLVKAAFTRGRA